jgi:hypothetical protein
MTANEIVCIRRMKMLFSAGIRHSAIETLNKLAKTFRILFVLRIHFFHNVECGKTILVVIKNISSVFRQF